MTEARNRVAGCHGMKLIGLLVALAAMLVMALKPSNKIAIDPHRWN